jgi:hypothetical protein
MFLRLIPAFVLVLGLVQAGHDKGKEKPKETPKPSPDADLVAFAKDLDGAGKDKIADIVHAFAQKHGSKDKAVTMTSADKKVHVVIGAPGSEKSPNAADVDFKAEGTQYNVAVGGKGGDAKADAGGNGASIKLNGKSAGKTYLFGGDGGSGAKKGGKGGSVWTGKDWAGATSPRPARAGARAATAGKSAPSRSPLSRSPSRRSSPPTSNGPR